MARLVAGVASVMVAACGGSSSTPPPDVGGPSGDAANPDAAQRCGSERVFGPLEAVRFVNTAGPELYGWLSEDSLSLYFTTTVAGTENRDVFVATRDFAEGLFGSPTAVSGVNTTDYSEERPVLTADGLTMFLVVSGTEILSATRPTIDDVFGSPFGVLHDPQFEFEPWISQDGLTLYLSSNRDGFGRDLYRATRSSLSSTFDPLVPLTELNTSEDERSPVLSRDGLELYFARYVGLGDYGIFRAMRTSTSAPFGVPTQVLELGSDGENFPNWLSPDGCTLVLTSSRPGGQGSWDLWMARRVP